MEKCILTVRQVQGLQEVNMEINLKRDYHNDNLQSIDSLKKRAMSEIDSLTPFDFVLFEESLLPFGIAENIDDVISGIVSELSSCLKIESKYSRVPQIVELIVSDYGLFMDTLVDCIVNNVEMVLDSQEDKSRIEDYKVLGSVAAEDFEVRCALEEVLHLGNYSLSDILESSRMGHYFEIPVTEDFKLNIKFPYVNDLVFNEYSTLSMEIEREDNRRITPEWIRASFNLNDKNVATTIEYPKFTFMSSYMGIPFVFSISDDIAESGIQLGDSLEMQNGVYYSNNDLGSRIYQQEIIKENTYRLLKENQDSYPESTKKLLETMIEEVATYFLTSFSDYNIVYADFLQHDWNDEFQKCVVNTVSPDILNDPEAGILLRYLAWTILDYVVGSRNAIYTINKYCKGFELEKWHWKTNWTTPYYEEGERQYLEEIYLPADCPLSVNTGVRTIRIGVEAALWSDEEFGKRFFELLDAAGNPVKDSSFKFLFPEDYELSIDVDDTIESFETLLGYWSINRNNEWFIFHLMNDAPNNGTLNRDLTYLPDKEIYMEKFNKYLKPDCDAEIRMKLWDRIMDEDF